MGSHVPTFFFQNTESRLKIKTAILNKLFFYSEYAFYYYYYYYYYYYGDAALCWALASTSVS
jgi:hypothetical protein